MLARAVRATISAASASVPPRLAWRSAAAAVGGTLELFPCRPGHETTAHSFSSKAEAGKSRVSKKKARQMKSFRRVLTPTEEVLPPHQVYATPGPAPEVPFVPGSSKRVGVLALKCGMLPEWDAWGERRALTVLKVRVGFDTGRFVSVCGSGSHPLPLFCCRVFVFVCSWRM